MIERAYRTAEAAGIVLCNQDEAGPYQTVPYPGESWEPEGEPVRQPHEYARDGTAKLLTLFRPAVTLCLIMHHVFTAKMHQRSSAKMHQQFAAKVHHPAG